jgi:hypothetical protein
MTEYGLEGMQTLVGKTILKVEVDNDGENYLRLWTDTGIVIVQADGDCCSESWFSDMIGTQFLIGGTVSAVRELDLPSYNVDDGRGRQESDQVYGYQFDTNKGSCDLIFRNSSNGYYGGELHIVDEARYDIVWKDITTDWSAS